MFYDILIIGGGASGLFCSMFLPKELKKCIIEKTAVLGSKVLLSGGERCNLTNISSDTPSHYVGQSLKSLPSLFHAFGPEDMISYLHGHSIETIEEQHGRILLKSGKSRQLVDFMIAESKNNETEHFLSHEVLSVAVAEDKTFFVTTSAGIYTAKKVIVATGGMTYPQLGASPFAYEIAEQLGLHLSAPHAALCGIETGEDVSSLAGNTVQATLILYRENKIFSTAKGPLLFTHTGISGPIVFDATLYIDDVSRYALQIDFDLSGTSKKVIQRLKLAEGDTIRDFKIKSLRSIQEAKVSVGGILLADLDQRFQSKNIPGLYFIGESLDITGKTGGYNLQRAWTSAFVCAKGITG